MSPWHVFLIFTSSKNLEYFYKILTFEFLKLFCDRKFFVLRNFRRHKELSFSLNFRIISDNIRYSQGLFCIFQRHSLIFSWFCCFSAKMLWLGVGISPPTFKFYLRHNIFAEDSSEWSAYRIAGENCLRARSKKAFRSPLKISRYFLKRSFALEIFLRSIKI